MIQLPDFEFPKIDIRHIELPHFDWEKFGRQIRNQKDIDLGYAHVIFERLVAQITDFEKTLKINEEVGAYLASFGTKIIILVESIGYHDPYFIIFCGTDIDVGTKVRLVQHVSQISVLLTALKVKPEENRKAKRIGFFVEKEEERAKK